MINSFSSLCDDFFVDMYLNSELELPSERDTVLTFFERIQKEFPSLGNFFRRDTGEFALEEEKHGERYRWVNLEMDRVCAGCANPEQMDEAYSLQKLVLELAPYMLGVNHIDVDSLDLTFTMDFDYMGNHDEVVAEALFTGGAFRSLIDLPGAKPIGFSPSAIIALSSDCRTQARITVESRTNLYEVRTGRYKSEEPISLYFTVRQFPRPDEKFDVMRSFLHQCKMIETLMAEQIIPNFAQPLINAIAQRR